MKRILLVLSFLFFVLWVAALFYPGRTTMGIHIALIVALLFFVRSLIVIPAPMTKDAQDDSYKQSVKKHYQGNDMEQVKQA